MKPVIALPFTEFTVRVAEEYDPTCLLRVRGQRMRVVGRRSITHNGVHIHTEQGWKCATPHVVPVVEVISKE